ncbi:hypothetical protein BSKO_08626 [Bryopsis sp. KO-2023]|nr:hypothetical protein BSKO_08626 [Bryopsis sp. KO-2023]
MTMADMRQAIAFSVTTAVWAAILMHQGSVQAQTTWSVDVQESLGRELKFINHEGPKFDYHALYWGPSDAAQVQEYVDDYKTAWYGHLASKLAAGHLDHMRDHLCDELPEFCETMTATEMDDGSVEVKLQGLLVIVVHADGEGACDVQVDLDVSSDARGDETLPGGADVFGTASLAAEIVCTDMAAGSAVIIIRLHGKAGVFYEGDQCSPFAIAEHLGVVSGEGFGISAVGSASVATEAECLDGEGVVTTVLMANEQSGAQFGDTTRVASLFDAGHPDL